MMKNIRIIRNIIKALSSHQDAAAVEVLERLGTNSDDDEIRRLTSKALVTRNTHESLSLVILEKGKGINDMSTTVAMSTINELLALEDKTEAMKILSDTAELHSEEEIRDTARSVKTLMIFS